MGMKPAAEVTNQIALSQHSGVMPEKRCVRNNDPVWNM
jgi:hypothetical protein